MVAANGQLAQIRQLQRQLAAAGWDPREIARVILDRFPGVSVFASWRYGYGWSSQRAVDEIKKHYRLPPGSRRLSRSVGLDVTRLNEWEHWPRSGVRPGLLYQEACSRAYGVPVSELGLTDEYEGPAPGKTLPVTQAASDEPQWWEEPLRRGVVPELLAYFEVVESGRVEPRYVVHIDGRTGHMDRRQFQQLLGALSGSAAARALAGIPDPDDRERLGLAVDDPRRVDTRVVEYFTSVLAQHRRADDLIGPRHLREPVAGQLALLERFVAAANPAIKPALLDVAAQFAQFHGWQWHSSGEPSKAAYWCDRAIGWAMAAGNHPLAGYIFERKASQAADAGNAAEAIALARHAQEPSWRLTPRVAGWAARAEARAHAVNGDLTAAQRKLDQALDALASTDARGEPPWIYFFGETQLMASRAISYTDAGRPDLALPTFDDTLNLLPDEHHRPRGLYKIYQAEAYRLANEPDQAARTAKEAATLAVETGTGRTLTKVHTLQSKLTTHHPTQPDVRDLTDFLTSIN